ncbi:hypothetical protein [Brevibacillus porteri]|uniref:hypothetical protein n=1 Tax=Brevibacillus porteri TaxID=2126350 RepID=UPI00364520F2
MSTESRQLAIQLEHRARAIFNCDRGGLGGVVDSDFIDSGGWYTVIVSCLAKFYVGVVNIQYIDEYLDNYSFLANMKITDSYPQFKASYDEFTKLLKMVKTN